jgi:hypothetical protein
MIGTGTGSDEPAQEITPTKEIADAAY